MTSTELVNLVMLTRVIKKGLLFISESFTEVVSFRFYSVLLRTS